MKRKCLSVIMALTMILSLLPATAFASGGNGDSDTYVASVEHSDTTTEYSSLSGAIDKAGDGDKVTLLKSVELSENLTITKGITFDLGGYELSFTDPSKCVSVSRALNPVTIQNGTVVGGNIGIQTNVCSLVLIGVHVKAGQKALTDLGWGATSIIAQNSSFEVSGSTSDLTAIYLKDNYYSLSLSMLDCDVTVSGGSNNRALNVAGENIQLENCTFTSNSTNSTVLITTRSDIPAEIRGTTTITNTAENGKALDIDAFSNAPVVISGNSVTMNGVTTLNGTASNSTAKLTIEGGKFAGGLVAPVPANLTVTGGLFDRDISDLLTGGYECVANQDSATNSDYPYTVSKAAGEGDVAYVWNPGEDRVFYYTLDDAIDAADGNPVYLIADVVVEDPSDLSGASIAGTASGKLTFTEDLNTVAGSLSGTSMENVTLVCGSDTFSGISMTDGKLTAGSFLRTDCNKYSDLLASGYLFNGDGTGEVTTIKGEDAFDAKIGGIGYSSLVGAINAASQNDDGAAPVNDTVVMLADHDSAITVSDPNSTFTLDMAGHKITSNSDYAFAIVGTGAVQPDGANITIQNGSIIATGEDTFGVSTNGVNTDITLTMENVAVTSETLAAYFPADGVYTITGGSYEGDILGIELRAGTLNISGNTVVTGGSGEVSTAPSGSGNTVVNAALAVSQHTTKKPIHVTVSGGTFTGGAAVYQANVQGNDQAAVDQITLSVTGGTFNGQVYSENKTGFITGGTFSEVPNTAYMASGYEAIESNGTYIVAQKGASPVTGVTLNETTLSLMKGNSATLTATVLPQEAFDKTVTWTSSDVSVATVENGVVTAQGVGQATITAASSADSTKYAVCVVTVTDEGAVLPTVKDPDTSVSSSITEDTDITAANTVAGTVEADSAIQNAAIDQADSLSGDQSKQEELKQEAADKGLAPQGEATINLFTQTFLSVEATDISRDEQTNQVNSITLNITPMVQVVASTADNSGDINLTDGEDRNAVVVDDPKPLTIRTQAVITVTLPEAFWGETVFVKHQASNGRTYFYQAVANESGEITFTSTHGFSPFTFSLENGAAAVVGGVGYETFQEAVDAAANGDTISVCASGEGGNLSATVSGSSRTITVRNDTAGEITVRLNGSAMTLSAGKSAAYTYTAPVTPSYSGSDDDGYSVSVPASSGIKGGSITVSPRSADKGETVTILVDADEGYQLDTLTVTDDKGNSVKLTDQGRDKYTFTMPSGRVKVEVSFCKLQAAPVNPFTDVVGSAYYHDAVLWAVENGVTSGTSATTFGPNVTVTRGQMMTFLWRAHGSPKATGSNPFTDVSTSDYYYDAVLWAVKSGITSGTSATTFSPDAPVTRAQAVTFQWQAAGAPAVTGSSFGDVSDDAYYATAVSWAVANGITGGTGNNQFSPEMPVSRAQAVTFLYQEQK